MRGYNSYTFLSPQSDLLTVGDNSLDAATATGAQRATIKKAMKMCEGFASKIHGLYFLKLYNGTECPNAVGGGLDFDGTFRLTPTGSPTAVATGAELDGVGQYLNSHFVNDQASAAPGLGCFYITDIAVDDPVVESTGGTPFLIQARFSGNAHVNIWGGQSGVAVPSTPTGFVGGQRVDNDNVAFFQGTTKYPEAATTSSPAPIGGTVIFKGNNTAAFVLKAAALVEALTDGEVATLKTAMEYGINNL